MKDIKKLILLLIALLMAIIVVIVIIITSRQTNEQIENELEFTVDFEYYGIEATPEAEIVQDEVEFFSVVASVNQYLMHIESNNAEAVYAILDDRFISENNINVQNVLGRMIQLDGMVNFRAVQMHYASANVHNRTFFVHGILTEERFDAFREDCEIEDRDNCPFCGPIISESEEFFITVNVDIMNGTFSVVPSLDNVMEVVELYYDFEVNSQRPILENDYNSFRYQRISQEAVAMIYFDYYIRLLLVDSEQAFTILEEKYRERRFNNFTEFERYLERNRSELTMSRLVQYEIIRRNDYRQFILEDNNGRVFIFRETAIMQFSVILDTHTLDLPEFVQAYNSTNSQGRVALNIQRFIDAINRGDYRFAYNRLAEGFRNNNFATLQSFESYINILPERIRIEYGNFTREGSVYTYSVRLFDRNNVNAMPIEKVFIMQLQEGTDFVLSFNII